MSKQDLTKKEDDVTLHFLNFQAASATYSEKSMRNSGKLHDRAEKKKWAENDWGGSADNNPAERKQTGLVRPADDTTVVG
ncbi:hypothetical protein Tco_0784026 [Tanacetum coccineum]